MLMAMRTAFAVGGGLLVALTSATGCSARSSASSARSSISGRALIINERVGSVGGVAIGSPRRRIVRLLGRGKDTSDSGGRPLGANYDAIGGPGNEPFPPRCQRRPPPQSVSPRGQGVTSLSYHGKAFDLCDERVFFFIVTAPGTRTLRHVAIGQPIRTAMRAYPNLHCGQSTGDSTDPPVPLYPYCVGRIAPSRYLWFGQDPIRSIAVASVHLIG
jgi:hypothetical protein